MKSLPMRGGEDNEGQDDGTRALSPRLQDALIQYQGNVSVQNILSRLRGTTQPNATLADAQAINRQFGSYLYRDLSVLEKDTLFDRNIRGYLGNSVFVTDDFELGRWRPEAIPTNGETTCLNRSFAFPEERTDERLEATQQVTWTAIAAVDSATSMEHEVSATARHCGIRKTIPNSAPFNENRQRESGNGFQDVGSRSKSGDVLITQYQGEPQLWLQHETGLKGSLRRVAARLPHRFHSRRAEYNWFYSDSKAETSIPSEVNISSRGPRTRTSRFPLLRWCRAPRRLTSQPSSSTTMCRPRLGSEGLPHTKRLTLEVSGGYNHSPTGPGIRPVSVQPRSPRRS